MLAGGSKVTQLLEKSHPQDVTSFPTSPAKSKLKSSLAPSAKAALTLLHCRI